MKGLVPETTESCGGLKRGLHLVLSFAILLAMVFTAVCCDIAGDDDSTNGDTDSSGDPPSDGGDAELIDGTYKEDDEYHHFDIVDAGGEMRVYVVGDEPNTYCQYTERGVLPDNPSTGFTVSGTWLQLRAEDTYCGWIAGYAILRQVSDTEIHLRSSTVSFEHAYNEGNRTFTKQ